MKSYTGHFSLGCHFQDHFSNLWPAFASRGLPAIAELVVRGDERSDGRKKCTPLSLPFGFTGQSRLKLN